MLRLDLGSQSAVYGFIATGSEINIGIFFPRMVHVPCSTGHNSVYFHGTDRGDELHIVGHPWVALSTISIAPNRYMFATRCCERSQLSPSADSTASIQHRDAITENKDK